MTKDEIIEILENNKINIEHGDWDTVYESIAETRRGDFSEFLIENDIDPDKMFKKEIPECAFHGCESLKSVTIPNSITSIGDSAFWNCLNLTSVTIPSSVREIGALAFSWCSSLTSITIPNSVTEIGIYTFAGCALLTTITIPNSVKIIDRYAFQDCKSLNEIKYDGTEEQWEKVQLCPDWNKDCPAKVVFLR